MPRDRLLDLAVLKSGAAKIMPKANRLMDGDPVPSGSGVRPRRPSAPSPESSRNRNRNKRQKTQNAAAASSDSEEREEVEKHEHQSGEDQAQDGEEVDVVESESDDDGNGGGDNYSEIDIDTFAVNYEMKIRNFHEVIHEKPNVTWKFRRPSSSSSSPLYQLRIDLSPGDRMVLQRTPAQHSNRNGGPSRGGGGGFLYGNFQAAFTNLGDRTIKFRAETKVFNGGGNSDGDRQLMDSRTSSVTVLRPGMSMAQVDLQIRPTTTLRGRGVATNNSGSGSNTLVILAVTVDMTCGLNVQSRHKKICTDNINPAYRTLVEDVARMREEGGGDDDAFNDIKLTVVGSGQSFPCSKFLLCARSEVFRAMFSVPMRESAENEVKIEDVEPTAVADLLEFVYTDEVRHLTMERAIALLKLSERYALAGLSLFCCEALSKNLTVDSVCKIAMVAEQHALQDLREKAIGFMFVQATRVTRSDGWKDLLAACPDIANRVVEQLCNFYDDNSRSQRAIPPPPAPHVIPVDWHHPPPQGAAVDFMANVMVPPLPANLPEEEVQPMYPNVAVHNLDEDEADNHYIQAAVLLGD